MEDLEVPPIVDNNEGDINEDEDHAEEDDYPTFHSPR